jgi:hypothetical protein
VAVVSPELLLRRFTQAQTERMQDFYGYFRGGGNSFGR